MVINPPPPAIESMNPATKAAQARKSNDFGGELEHFAGLHAVMLRP
jgi:hypothetical protein